MAASENGDGRLDSGTGYKSNLVLQVVHDGNDAAADHGNNNTFTCFPALPPELRFQIWEYLIQPRIVLVAYFDPRVNHLGHDQLRRQPYRPATPALLHVNHESRALALRHYEQAFSWASPGDSTRPTEPHAWFNFGLDALWFLGGLDVHGRHGHATMVSGFASNDLRRVRHVAVAFRALRSTRRPSDQEHGMLYSISQMFSSAQRLLVTNWQQDAAAMWPLPVPLFATASGILLNIRARFVAGITCVSEVQGKQIRMLWEHDLAGFIAEHR